MIMAKPSETYAAKAARNRKNYQARKLRAQFPGLAPLPTVGLPVVPVVKPEIELWAILDDDSDPVGENTPPQQAGKPVRAAQDAPGSHQDRRYP